MMNYGFSYGYNNGGGSSTSSSNLSASAPPFTVDRSVAKPLLDLTEPTYPVSLNSSLHSWVTSNSHISNSRPDLFPIPSLEFDSVPSPLAFGTPRLFPNAIYEPPSSEPYYPSSYVSPAIAIDDSLKILNQSGYELLSASHVGTSNGSTRDDYSQSLVGLEHTTQWSGLWEGVSDWHQSKKLQLDGSFCAKENFINQGFSAFKDISKCEETSLGIGVVGRQMHTESANTGDKAFLGEKPKFMPAGYSTPSPLVFPSVEPQAYLQVQSSNVHDASPNDSMPVMKPSPAVVIRSPGKDTYSFKNMKTGCDGDEKGNSSSSVQEPNPFISSEGKVFYDSSQIKLPSNKNISVDVLDQIFKSKMDDKVPCGNLDFFNLAMDGHEAIGSAENTSERAPVSLLSAFEVSEVVNALIPKKVEACNGLTTNDAVKACPEKQSSISVPLNESLGRQQASLFKRPLVAKVLFREEIDDTGKYGPYQRIPSYCHEAQISDVIDDETWIESILSDFNSVHTEQRNLDDGEWPSKKDSCVADVRRKINDDPDYCSSHIPFHAIEQILSSPSSSEHAPAQHTQSLEFRKENSTQESLSPQQATSQFPGKFSDRDKGQLEFQQFEEEEEHKIASVKSKEKLSSWVSTRFAADTVKDDNMTRSQILLYKNLWLEAEASLCSVNYMARCNRMKIEMEKGNSQKANDFSSVAHVVPEKSMVMENLSRPKVSSDILFADDKGSPVQDVSFLDSSILGRNSHSDDVMAKFHILKSRVSDSNSVNTSAVERLSSSMVSPDLNKVDKLAHDTKDSTKPNVSIQDSQMSGTSNHADDVSIHADDVIARFHILKGRVDNSSFPDLNKVDKMVYDTKDSTKPHITIQDSPMARRSSHADDVMARFRTLKGRVDNSNSVNISAMEKLPISKAMEILPISKVSSDLSNAGGLTVEGKDSTKPDITKQDSPLPSSSNHAEDFEAAIMARLLILEHRDGCSSSLEMEERQPESIDIGYTSLRREVPMGEGGLKDRILDDNMEPVIQNYPADSAEDKSTVKEFRLFPHPTSCWWYDSFSSDWEHVLKEEIVGQGH
ncbi:Plant peroxidase [Salix suchowensis]|nr:Plant peroxidase [Salix suchowensis]